MGTHPWHEKSHVFPTEAKGFDEKLWETEMARQALHLEQTKVRFRVNWMMSTAPPQPPLFACQAQQTSTKAM